MSAKDAIARDENSGIPSPLAPEIPDIFIPPTQNGSARVTGGRNENSGMTTRDAGKDSFSPSPLLRA